MDGRNPAPPQKPCNDDSPANTKKEWFPLLSKWCRISSIHSSMGIGFVLGTISRAHFWVADRHGNYVG